MSTPFDLDTVDRLLSTTRAVRRRLDLDRPVEPAVIHDCIRLSQQAPTASNRQTWRWLVVTDETLRTALAAIYRRGLPALDAAEQRVEAGDHQTARVYDSARWLVEHLARVPVHVIPCLTGRLPERFSPVLASSAYGSIFPAIWSFQLALRSRGLGSVLTTLHLAFESEVAELLGVPEDVLQVALIPVAYTRGLDFRPARRPPPESITWWNRWGESLDPGGAV
jgi:nitroreductase